MHFQPRFFRQVCFSDESIFTVMEESSQYVRRRQNEEFKADCIQQTVKHPTSVMVWAVMSIKGPGRFCIVEGTMRQEQYINVLKDRLLPQINEWHPDKDCIFMHDGAPCHKAKSVTKFLAEHQVRTLPWPGNSPDMNPIENLWAIVKRRVRKTKITTKHELISKLIKVWFHDDDIKKSCKSLIESMPTRINALIKNRGQHTKY